MLNFKFNSPALQFLYFQSLAQSAVVSESVSAQVCSQFGNASLSFRQTICASLTASQQLLPYNLEISFFDPIAFLITFSFASIELCELCLIFTVNFSETIYFHYGQDSAVSPCPVVLQLGLQGNSFLLFTYYHSMIFITCSSSTSCFRQRAAL